ncbi:formyltetrahydrofolate deformylase [soil metagenome]
MTPSGTLPRAHVGRLLISCPDRPGIVAAVSRFLFEHGANVLDSSQHSTDPSGGVFFMRMVFHLDALDVSRAQLESDFESRVAEPFDMTWRVAYGDRRKRLAIFVSRLDHCLLELLWRVRAGEIDADIVLVVSNHGDLEELVASFGIAFVRLHVTPETKVAQEGLALARLESERVDGVVLARYMQILTSDFVNRYQERIINIHHSFLPSFVGADPYRRAYERGVKLIGATAHFVTDALDEGPIVEQDVRRVSHKESVGDLTRIGRDAERSVLARAVRAFVEDRVLVYANKTIVFD